MNTSHILARAFACLLLGAACAHASAQTSTAAGAADPQAAVPATTYQSAINQRVEPAPAASPDQAWRDANATVAGYNSMALTMKSMAGHAEHGQTASSAADPHAGHVMPAGAAADPHAGHTMPMGADGGMCKPGAQGGGMCGGQDAKADAKGCACCKGMQSKDGAHAHHEGMKMAASADGGMCKAGAQGSGMCGGQDAKGCACCKGMQSRDGAAAHAHQHKEGA